MTTTVTPFLMFQGEAEAALDFYVSLFEDAEVTEIERQGPDEPDAKGALKARFVLHGQSVMIFDSPVKHAFSPTPAFSFFVECGTSAEVDRLVAALGEGGQTLMPLDAYPFSPRYAWLTDRFGVSWQVTQRE